MLKSIANRIIKKINLIVNRRFQHSNPILVKDQKEGSYFSEFSIPKIEKPFDLVFAGYALKKLLVDYSFNTILDIGSGGGQHSQILFGHGKTVTSIDFGESIYFEKREGNYNLITGDYYQYSFDEQFDAIWASHVLEHQPNPNLFLRKIFNDLKEGGILAITVPPLKHEIVGGHLSLWNAGLLLYHLVFAGFDCSQASVLKYGYNISVIIKKQSIMEYPNLTYDHGDIQKLLAYFPEGFSEPFNGDIQELNWFTK